MFRFFCVACFVHAFIVIHVSGTSMILSPSSVVLNEAISRELTMTCSLTTTEQNTEVLQLASMRITRYSTRESNINKGEGEVIALLFGGGQPQLGLATDITTRNPGITGQLVKDGKRNNGEIKMTWNSSQIQCVDEGMYVCTVAYTGTDQVDGKWTESSNLTTTKYPEKVDMRYMNNFMQDVTDTTTITKNQGEVVEMSCTANIGGDKTKRIDWYQTKTFDPDNADDLQRFTAMAGDVFDEGTVSDTMTDCSYSLTSTLKYNITETDRQRTEPFKFECRVDYTTTTGLSVSVASKRITISVVKQNEGGNTDEVASAGGSATGIIAGVIVGVLALIVLVVLLLYFLWYRKRKGGETCSTNVAAIIGGVIGGLVLIVAIVVLVCLFWFRQGGGSSYRTKEENGGSNPNLAPETTTYATPQKDRKGGFENDGLDEPHQDRSRTRNNYRDRDQDRNRDVWDHRDGRDRGGRANHGMDREHDSDSSPSMTPRMNHMGSDPQENFGTGV